MMSNRSFALSFLAIPALLAACCFVVWERRSYQIDNWPAAHQAILRITHPFHPAAPDKYRLSLYACAPSLRTVDALAGRWDVVAVGTAGRDFHLIAPEADDGGGEFGFGETLELAAEDFVKNRRTALSVRTPRIQDVYKHCCGSEGSR